MRPAPRNSRRRSDSASVCDESNAAPIRGERNVGDRQIQIGDHGHEDERQSRHRPPPSGAPAPAPDRGEPPCLPGVVMPYRPADVRVSTITGGISQVVPSGFGLSSVPIRTRRDATRLLLGHCIPVLLGRCRHLERGDRVGCLFLILLGVSPRLAVVFCGWPPTGSNEPSATVGSSHWLG